MGEVVLSETREGERRVCVLLLLQKPSKERERKKLNKKIQMDVSGFGAVLDWIADADADGHDD
jgi:hypothetical protein